MGAARLEHDRLGRKDPRIERGVRQRQNLGCAESLEVDRPSAHNSDLTINSTKNPWNAAMPLRRRVTATSMPESADTATAAARAASAARPTAPHRRPRSPTGK